MVPSRGLCSEAVPLGVRVMAVLCCEPLPCGGQGVRPLSLVTWLLSMETKGDTTLCFPACFSCPVSYSVNHITWKDGSWRASCSLWPSGVSHLIRQNQTQNLRFLSKEMCEIMSSRASVTLTFRVQRCHRCPLGYSSASMKKTPSPGKKHPRGTFYHLGTCTVEVT